MTEPASQGTRLEIDDDCIRRVRESAPAAPCTASLDRIAHDAVVNPASLAHAEIGALGLAYIDQRLAGAGVIRHTTWEEEYANLPYRGHGLLRDGYAEFMVRMFEAGENVPRIAAATQAATNERVRQTLKAHGCIPRSNRKPATPDPESEVTE